MARRKAKKKNKKKYKKIARELPLRHELHKSYIRLKVKYPIWFVLNNIGDWVLTIAGKRVKMGSMRYRTFKEKGTICVNCGLRGTHFRLERHALGIRKTYHFNLYAINDNGNEVLMTKDHIIPKSKGGTNHINNLQTMCCKCNCKKDDAIGIGANW